MDYYRIAFYAFGAVTVLAALVAVWSRNLIHAGMGLLLSLFGVAGLYALAGADFLAVVQILVYVGGIVILLLFGIMLTQRITGRAPRTGVTNRLVGALAALAVLGVLLAALLRAGFAELPWIAQAGQINEQTLPPAGSTVERLGRLLVGEYLLLFEVAALVLTIALIGAAYMARRSRDEGARPRRMT
ncbi:MAG: NADH-quinone oxidoreductase subunit J [Bacteroidetes bacterium]|nr:NADH-quinone oxidoreductase subunit J [Rhodothermia bacterium]MCS7155522.1 NADH-quinone oxidoreductase subunit J [Bacteroidota bacterium]MCX7907385.1 NADH-quinone oxidoreductase subunit J [Bacteroidota bacterium]MDW8138379.1 NADH-quinone oxidoreductase subunit J [Bacteroidota bacterium]MDW8284684.1 NADH-quinone oxidoreductase subunit J [Bacteroidota bacterium]